jgi:hypothetical protein
MKRSITVLAIAATLASFGAFADAGSPKPVSSTYEYGMPLDVAKVISITPPSNAADCQVGTAHMVYVDHQGQTHELDYSEMGNCAQL